MLPLSLFGTNTALIFAIGTGKDRPVVILQLNGQMSSSSFTLSYLQCPAGTIPAALDCRNCSIGTYNPIAGSSSCSVCAPRHHSAIDQSVNMIVM
jgi:hypothetical protein